MSAVVILALLAAAPPAVTVHRASVRFDLARGVPIGGSAEDAAPLPSAPLRLRGVRDEVLTFQLAVRLPTGTGEAGRLAIEAVAPAGTRIEIFAEHGVPVAQPSVSTVARPLGPGLYPDPLVPTSTISVPAEPGVAVVWVDLWITPQAAAGVHGGRVRVGDAAPIELAVEVLDVALPAADVARIGAVSFGSLLDRRARSPQQFQAWMQAAHAHRLTIELMHTRISTAADGALDWARWADEWAPLVEGSAFTSTAGYQGPRAGLPIGRFVIPLSDKVPGPRTAALLPRDPQRWSQELKRWEGEVLRRGWLARPEATQWIVFINSLDEPRHASMLESIRRYGELIDAAGLADRRHVSMRIDGPFAQNAEGWSDRRIVEDLAGAVDLWCACGGTPWIPWSLLSSLREDDPHEGLMFYASNSAGEPATPPLVLDAELTHARAWGWVIRRYGLAGALNWEVDFRPGCAQDPLCSTYGLNSDANLFYRGEELGRATDEPIASMRLKMLRRGAEDAALVSLLEARDAEAARALLERMVPEAMGDGHDHEGPGSWPTEGAAYDRARDEILDRLTGKVPPSPPPGASRPWLIGGVALFLAFLVVQRIRRLAASVGRRG